MSPATADDRAFVREVLPRVSRTFAVNIEVLGGAMRESVRIAYLWCRAADALEDSWPGSPAEIGGRFDTLLEAVEGRTAAADGLARDVAALGPARPDLELVSRLPALTRAYGDLPAEDRDLIADAVRVMARGMRRYAVRAAERGIPIPEPGRDVPVVEDFPAYLDTEAELHDYCWVVAGCVGVMLTRMFSWRHPAPSPEVLRERLEMAPVVGSALQLTNIYLDWPRDLRRGRCHVPAEWLTEYQLTARELLDPRRAGARASSKRLEGLARGALSRVPEYLDVVPSRHVRYRMFVLWPALWAAASLEHARRDAEFPFGPRRPRLPRPRVAALARAAWWQGHSKRGVRDLLEQASRG